VTLRFIVTEENTKQNILKNIYKRAMAIDPNPVKGSGHTSVLFHM
jgi:hypothetical protein